MLYNSPILDINSDFYLNQLRALLNASFLQFVVTITGVEMGCASLKDTHKPVKNQTVKVMNEKDRIEMHLFANVIQKPAKKSSKSNNYQYYQSPVAPPLFKDGKPTTVPNFRDYDVLYKPQERIYKVPKISYPRLGLNMKDLQLKKS